MASKSSLSLYSDDSKVSHESHVELLESLSDEDFLPLLQEEVAPLAFPRQVGVRISKITASDIKLLHRFLKVDSVEPLTKKITKVVYIVKPKRLQNEVFQKKEETLLQELDRVRKLLANRKKWFELYAECIAIMSERDENHKQVHEINEFLFANEIDANDLDIEPEFEQQIEDAENRRLELFKIDAGLRKKENVLQAAMVKLDEVTPQLEKEGIEFDEDEAWIDDAIKESLDSLVVEVAEEEDDDDDDYARTPVPSLADFEEGGLPGLDPESDFVLKTLNAVAMRRLESKQSDMVNFTGSVIEDLPVVEEEPEEM